MHHRMIYGAHGPSGPWGGRRRPGVIRTTDRLVLSQWNSPGWLVLEHEEFPGPARN
jgi:hypothetical protein